MRGSPSRRRAFLPSLLAFGFLEWYEAAAWTSRATRRFSFFRFRITPKNVRGKPAYEITAREGAAETNVSLERFLDRSYGRLLPAFVAEGEDAPSIEQYLAAAAAAIEGLPNWKVRRWLIAGNFAFSRIALYEDTRRDRWPNLFGHPLVTSLLAGYESEAADPSSPRPGRLPDRRSGDREAGTDPHPRRRRLAAFGPDRRDEGQGTLVIEGPPGTGKSQTITNIIANALANDQTVLFLAEKRAALDVVKSRLDSAGLGEYCLENHSDKSSPRSVIASLRQRFEGDRDGTAGRAAQRAARWRRRCALGTVVAEASRRPQRQAPDGATPFELMWTGDPWPRPARRRR